MGRPRSTTAPREICAEAATTAAAEAATMKTAEPDNTVIRDGQVTAAALAELRELYRRMKDRRQDDRKPEHSGEVDAPCTPPRPTTTGDASP